MATPLSSEASSPREREPVMECHLVLNALSGTVVNISMSVAKFDRFEDLEDHVVDYLASVTDLKVFGCTVDFLQNGSLSSSSKAERLMDGTQGEPQLLVCGSRTTANLVQRWHEYHARIGHCFTCFTCMLKDSDLNAHYLMEE